jgi:hypothetical protein
VGGFTTNVDVNPSPIFTVTNNAADICSGSTVDIDLLSPTANATITLDNVDYGTAGGTLANGQTFTPGTMLNEVLTNCDKCPGDGNLYVQRIGEWLQQPGHPTGGGERRPDTGPDGDQQYTGDM